MKTFIAASFALLLATNVTAQNDFCSCADDVILKPGTVNSLTGEMTFTTFFPPTEIAAAGKTKATLSTVYQGEDGKKDPKVYTQRIFKFNAKGQVVEMTEFTENINNFKTTYTYTESGLLSQSIMMMLNADGKPMQSDFFTGRDVVDYTYDASNRIIKIKHRSPTNDEEMPDELSNLTSYSYDEQGRLSEVIEQEVVDFGEPAEQFVWRYTYNDNMVTREMFAMGDMKFNIETSTYDKKKQKWTTNLSNGTGEELLLTTSGATSKTGQLLSTTSFNTAAPNYCRDEGNFTTTFSYTKKGLLTGSKSTYAKDTCLLSVTME